MKRVLIICLCLLLCACGSKENVEVEKTSNNKKNTKEVKEAYQDNNNTVVGLYKERGNKLELVTDYSTDISSSKDIDVYQIYFSNERNINLDSVFGMSYYNMLNSLDNPNIKVGFNIKYSLDNGEIINQTVLNPSQTIQNEYIFLYLYDDYKNRNTNFYSHIEDSEYDDSTLFTSVKVFANKVDNLSSDIEFTVFTYDTDDDFEEGNYRGTSKYTINISNK